MMKNENNVCQFVADAESGRSMVEMLGVLAIMGVLSAGAIGGYSYAMNKHRTNELIYEATKQAQWAGTQKEMNRSGTPTVAGGSFGGGSISSNLVAGLPDTQIGIILTDLDEAVCKNLVKNVEQNPNGAVKAVRDETGTGPVNCESGTASLIFNRDLSTGELQAGSAESGESDSGLGNVETTAAAVQTLDCGEHGEQAGNACLCEDGWTGDTCEVESTDPETYENQPCDDNDDCGSYGTYFCKYTYTSVDCTGPTAQGKCTKTSTIRGSGGGYVWSTTSMDWFSAVNFCAASGKEMVSFDELNCPYTLAQYKSNGKWGYCCADDSNSIGTGCNNNYSSGIITMRNAGVPEITRYYWMKTLTEPAINYCPSFVVILDSGYIGTILDYKVKGTARALCE